MPVNAWINEFNDIIRYVIFPDAELRELMMLPANTSMTTVLGLKYGRMMLKTASLTLSLVGLME